MEREGHRVAKDAASGAGDAADDRPVLPDRAEGDRDEAWGEQPDDDAAADRRLWEDRPPHHDDRSSR